RRALPAPDSSAVATHGYEAPMGEIEIALAQIWQDLLGLEQVGRHDHFFALGGHSLMIVHLIEQLRSFGWQLDVRSVFATPILTELAHTILTYPDDTNVFVVPPNLIVEGCAVITPDMLPLVSLEQTEIDTIVETVTGGARNVQDIYPLAPLQEGILFHHLLQAQGDDYLLQTLLAFNTRQHLDAFLSALQQVIDRHDILRTAVCWQGLTQPVQVVWRQASLCINNFTPATADDVLTQLRAHTDPRRYRLDLNRAPLFAADIAHDPAQDEWLLALRFHHLVSDHITLELIFAEIAQIQQGNAEMLPVALPYRNFITQILSVPASEHEAFFRDQLAGIDVPTAPFGVLFMPDNDDTIAKASLSLSSVLAQAVRTQARRLGVSPSVLFHVACAQVLAQTSGSDDVVFGSVLLGRLQGVTGADQILGMFINTLPMRVSLVDYSVQEVVQATYRSLTTLLEHEQAPLALAQQCSGIAQPMPLFSTLLNYRHSQMNNSQLGKAEADASETIWADIRLVSAEERTNYPITLSVDDLGDGFQLTALTIASIDPARLTAYLATALSGLVDALIHAPQQPILQVSILPDSERQQLLVDFNATQADFPQDALIHQLIETQVARTPGATAVVCGEQSLSYEELNNRANRLAHHLITLGVRPDDRVAICMTRSLEMVVGLLAILKAGGAYVPLDPVYPTERLVYMLEDAAPIVMLTQAEWADRLSNTIAINTSTNDVIPTAITTIVLNNQQEAFLTSQPVYNPDVQSGLTSHHLAYVIYTSGSTGLPKGVAITHRNTVNFLTWAKQNFSSEELINTLFATSLSFDLAVYECFAPLISGGTVHLVSDVLSLVTTEHPVSLINTVPSAIAHLLEVNAVPMTTQTVNLAGEALKSHIVERLFASTCIQHVCNLYGPSETTTYSTWVRMKRTEGFVHHIGRPIANTQIYILDHHGQPAPLGVIGEIHIAGVGVARGYLNRPELTDERFLPDPFSSTPDARMYKTGDLGRWLPDGNIEYLGRKDFQVKLRGFRIELGEIEARLMQCDGVREAVVILREDLCGNLGEDTSYEKAGEQKRLVAYLRPFDNVELVPAELRQQLAQYLADYMLPGAFVILETFPLTPNGKLDRQALPAPDVSAIMVRGYEAPMGEMEVALAEIWQNLLGLEQIGRHDHFFELGGHSLLAIQLVSRVRQDLARELPLQQLFANPLLANLAQTLTETSTTTQRVIPVSNRNQPLPLSFAQQRLWFLGQLDPATSLAYHIPLALRLIGTLNHHALITALGQLVARHESLRTRFVLIDGQPYQQIDSADIGFTLSCQDLRLLTPEKHPHRIAELTAIEAQTPFNFTEGPLIRGQLLQLTDEEHVLLLTQHHIISDRWSINVLIRELGERYRAILSGHNDPLPPLPIQYADYAVWQRDWLQEAALTQQREFWCQQLADAPALLTLPADRPRPSVQTYTGGQVSFHLDTHLLTSLKELGQRHNTTLFMTILTAWSIVLARLSGQDDVVIGTPVANRSHYELEGLIGFFVNTLALRVTLSDVSNIADLLAQVREQALAAYAHQDLPFEQLVEALQPERSLSYSPIFQVMLTLDNTSAQTLTLPDLQLVPIEQARHSAHFDLTLSLFESDSGLIGDLEYASDLFDHTTVERMVDYLKRVLTAMTADATQSIATLPILSESEQQRLLVDFNATQADFPPDALIHPLFEVQVEQHPDATALVFEGQTLSYGELNCRANRL
ncbi:non-ribosomal peptide synthetase, partial [Xenorhabdus sp. NBAII XenSa04]